MLSVSVCLCLCGNALLLVLTRFPLHYVRRIGHLSHSLSPSPMIEFIIESLGWVFAVTVGTTPCGEFGSIDITDSSSVTAVAKRKNMASVNLY